MAKVESMAQHCPLTNTPSLTPLSSLFPLAKQESLPAPVRVWSRTGEPMHGPVCDRDSGLCCQEKAVAGPEYS